MSTLASPPDLAGVAPPCENGGVAHYHSPNNPGAPLKLGGARLGARSHVCAFFRTPEEEYDALVPFALDGLRSGERAFITVDPGREGEFEERLRAAGVDLDAVRATGQLRVHNWNETHLEGGRFDPARTLGYFGGVSREGREQGFERTRFMTQMNWAESAMPGTEQLIEYEARANEIWNDTSRPLDPVICSYDIRRFSADLVVSAMQTHPVLLIGGIVQENPFYVEPERFLAELGAKGGGP